MKRLILVDGSAILHRAYHALPPLTTPDGTLVNAVYGFTSMLIKIVHDLNPSHVAVAFDRPKPTFRQELYKEYQAQRPKMEEDLVSQIDKVHQVITTFGIPIYEADGFEADDVIATIASQAQSPKLKAQSGKMDQIIIVTGDRDLLQLVDSNTFLYMPTKGLSEAKLYDEAAVKEKMGVTPKQIPDFKALAGDASDNYPGVPGVGPKTAAELLAQFGSVEALYKAGNKLPETLQKKLAEGKENAELGKELATVRIDAPVEFDLTKASIATLDTPRARKALEELHFPSLLKRLGSKVDQVDTAKSADKGDKDKQKRSKTEIASGQQELF